MRVTALREPASRAGNGETGDRPRVPALLIGAGTQALVEDVFTRDVSRGANAISRRIVAWGENAPPVEIPHRAIVISEAELTGQLRISSPEVSAESTDWTIHTGRSPVEPRRFGTRIASASPVTLREGVPRDACWIESLESGWLFLLPGWLLAVGGRAGGGRADDLLARSRLVVEQIESIDAPTGNFPAYPRISEPLCGPGISEPLCGPRSDDGGWLACGSAAMAFDPICGDGVGNAVREAILASAVIRASARGENVHALLDHYRTRLISAFLKHLALCRPFYAACPGDWWREELAQIEQGVAWCRAQLPAQPAFRFQLRGFELEPIASAAQTPA